MRQRNYKLSNRHFPVATKQEINRIRAENYYELYKPQYEQALKKQSQLVREKKQEEEKKLQQNQDSSKGYDRGPGFG